MRNLQTYEQYNESWRQVKPWLKLPILLLDKLLSKILKYVPNLKLTYDQLAAKIDFGLGLSPYKIKEEPKKITIDDIESKDMKKSLKLFLRDWNIYYMGDTKDPSRGGNTNTQRIWITKDELHKGDKYYGERISGHGLDFSKKFPQMYIVIAKHTEEHDEMSKERDIRYDKKKNKELTKKVKEMINRQSVTHKENFSGILLFWKCIEYNRFDLVDKILAINGNWIVHKYSIQYCTTKKMFDYLIDLGSYWDDELIPKMKNLSFRDDLIIKKIKKEPDYYFFLVKWNFNFSQKIKDALPYIFDSEELGLL